MDVERIAAFSEGDRGGNPAGVVICNSLPDSPVMQAIAADIGYSETVFAAPAAEGWRVRYFAPAAEVPFCGHATIALGAALARRRGDGVFVLQLNDGQVMVEGRHAGSMTAAFRSPPTRSMPASPKLVRDALSLFSYTVGDLDGRIPPAIASAGATHLILALRDRDRLGAMRYQLEAGRTLMASEHLVTVSLVHAETSRLFHARNAFAAGGVLEDPATGAAAAALGGYLRDLDWPHGGAIDIIQGEDMGMRSCLHTEITPTPGDGISVSGTARWMA